MSRRHDPTQIRDKRGGGQHSHSHNDETYRPYPDYPDYVSYPPEGGQDAGLEPGFSGLSISPEEHFETYGYASNATGAHHESGAPRSSTWPGQPSERYDNQQEPWDDEKQRKKSSSSKVKQKSSSKSTRRGDHSTYEDPSSAGNWGPQQHQVDAYGRPYAYSSAHYGDQPAPPDDDPKQHKSGGKKTSESRSGKHNKPPKSSKKGKEKEVSYDDGGESQGEYAAEHADPRYGYQQYSSYGAPHLQENDSNVVQDSAYSDYYGHHPTDAAHPPYHSSHVADDSGQHTSSRGKRNHQENTNATAPQWPDADEEQEQYLDGHGQQTSAARWDDGGDTGQEQYQQYEQQQYGSQEGGEQAPTVASEELLDAHEVNKHFSLEKPSRTVYLLAYTEIWTPAQSIYDVANSCFHLLSLKMVVALEYSVEEIDIGQMASFSTLAGRVKTVGTLMVWFRFTKKEKEQPTQLEFQVFDDMSKDCEGLKHDVIFKGNPEATAPKNVMMMVRPKHLNPQQSEIEQIRKNLIAQQQAIIAGRSRRKAREKALQGTGSNQGSSSKDRNK